MKKYINYGVYYVVRISNTQKQHIKAHNQNGDYVYSSYCRIEWLPQFLQSQG